MNQEWTELNKKMQQQIKSPKSFDEGIKSLLLLRNKIMRQIKEFEKRLSKEQMCAMPFMNAKGYHSKSIAYSLYHIFRIEDIVAHTLIENSDEVFFSGDYQKRMNSPIITTGNELVKQEIGEFSRELNLPELYQYLEAVDCSTTELLNRLQYQDLKTKYNEKDCKRIQSLGVVSESEESAWLIDYWCSKSIKGLIQMPFSRHWIMHVEASGRIAAKLL